MYSSAYTLVSLAQWEILSRARWPLPTRQEIDGDHLTTTLAASQRRVVFPFSKVPRLSFALEPASKPGQKIVYPSGEISDCVGLV